MRFHGEKKKNPVLLPVVLAVSNLCLQPGGKALADFYFCSSAIVSVLFLALFSQLAGLHTSAFYSHAGEAGAAAAHPQPPAAATQPAHTPSNPWEGRHGTRKGGGQGRAYLAHLGGALQNEISLARSSQPGCAPLPAHARSPGTGSGIAPVTRLLFSPAKAGVSLKSENKWLRTCVLHFAQGKS